MTKSEPTESKIKLTNQKIDDTHSKLISLQHEMSRKLVASVGITIAVSIALVTLSTSVSSSSIRSDTNETLTTVESSLHEKVEAIQKQLNLIVPMEVEERFKENEAALKEYDETLTELQTRMDLILKATEDKNVQTVIGALQNFSNMDKELTQIQDQIDAQNDRMWNMMYIAGVGSLIFLIKIFFFPSHD